MNMFITIDNVQSTFHNRYAQYIQREHALAIHSKYTVEEHEHNIIHREASSEEVQMSHAEQTSTVQYFHQARSMWKELQL